MNLSEEDWRIVRKLAKRTDSRSTTVYAKMLLAMKNGKGVRLSINDLEDVFADDAVSIALWYAITEPEQ